MTVCTVRRDPDSALTQYDYIADTRRTLRIALRILDKETYYRNVVMEAREKEIFDRALADMHAVMDSLGKRERDIWNRLWSETKGGSA